jgi:EmrB/QacA subfamily drug resistance transporter
MEKAKGIPYKWLVLLTVAIGSFMGTLDASIVNISFPRLTQVFETEPSVVMWVSVAYLLVSVGLMLTLGRLGDTFGRKRVYILGFTVFTLGLVLCSLSQSIVQLILARVVQAIGSAMTVALSTAIVTAAFPNEERGKALGILGGVVSSGLLSGPVLGGLILDALDWRAIFYIRVPVGIIGIIMALILLKEQKDAETGLKFDLGGAATLFGGLSCLLLFLNFGGRLGFTSPLAIILVVSAVALLALFIVFERRAPQPIVDLNLFRNRIFAAGNISLIIMFVAISANTFLMPFFLIDGLGYSASRTGLIFATISFTALIVGPVSGWLSDKVGSRILCTVGIALICSALFLLSRLSIESSEVDVIIRLVIQGVGSGMFSSPNNSSIMGSVPREKLSTGSAMIATVRQIGMSCGIAIAGTIFTSRQVFHAARFSLENLSQDTVQRMSLVGGFQDTLLFAAIACSIGIFTSLARGKQQPSD